MIFSLSLLRVSPSRRWSHAVTSAAGAVRGYGGGASVEQRAGNRRLEGTAAYFIGWHDERYENRKVSRTARKRGATGALVARPALASDWSHRVHKAAAARRSVRGRVCRHGCARKRTLITVVLSLTLISSVRGAVRGHLPRRATVRLAPNRVRAPVVASWDIAT